MGDDAELVRRLQAGDSEAFATLVERYHTSLMRVALTFVRSTAVAEEVVQDTWLGVVRGIERFEGRSSLKTWLYGILANRARTAGARERRASPLPLREPAVPPGRFGADGTWSAPPAAWADEADERLLAQQVAPRLRAGLETLPAGQREVVLLRDVEGLSAPEVCRLLDISEVNQRVLLHRGRSRLRHMVEAELGKS